jgi:prefoldin beta subunit
MENDQKIQELSRLQQSLANIASQKQQYDAQLSEYDSALKLLDSTNNAYKIIGGIMVKSSNEALKEDLNKKKEIAELRIKSFEKQEIKLREKAESLQKEIMSEMKKE